MIKRYFNADNGGATGSPSANQGGAVTSDGVSNVDPFASIDMDDLDPDTRKAVEASKLQFATLQKQNQQEAAARQHTERQAREFQSKHDALAAQLRQMTGGAQPPASNLESRLEKILLDKGITPEQAKVQAPLFSALLGEFGTELKGQIGGDLAPFANSVLQTEANNAWQLVANQDKLAALQIPEVAQKTWDSVQTLLAQGQNVNVSTIKNLRNMFYTEHLEAGNQPAPIMSNHNQPPTNYPNIGRSTYPGAGSSPSRPPVIDHNAPRTTLNSDTHAALANVFSRMEIQPKLFKKGK
jgi:hypothetical protein